LSATGFGAGVDCAEPLEELVGFEQEAEVNPSDKIIQKQMKHGETIYTL
jgi:hypothetical protein